MSKKKTAPPVVEDKEEDNCTCTDCAQKMIDQGLCPDCGGPIDECGAGEVDDREFNDCIMVKVGEDVVPLVIVGNDGKHYVGGLVNWGDDGIAWMFNALIYAEFIDKNSIMCGFQKPLQNVGTPERMGVKISTLYFLNKNSKMDISFVQTYVDALTRGKAKDSGLVLPNANSVPGLQ